MKKILDLITEEMEQAFADAGYEERTGACYTFQPPGFM